MSDEEKNKENIRELLRQKFEESVEFPEGWNEPSANVWASMSHKLSEIRKEQHQSRRNLWYGALIAGLLLLLMFRECAYREQLGSMEVNYDQLRYQYEQLQQNCTESQSVPTEKSAIPSKPDSAFSIPAQKNLQKISRKNGSVRSGIFIENALHSSEKVPDANRSANPADALIFYENRNDQPGYIPSENNKDEDFRTGELILAPFPMSPRVRQLQPLPVSVSFNERYIPSTTPSVIRFKRPSPFYFGILSGGTLAQNRLAGDIPDIIHSQQALAGWYSGIGFAAELSKRWTLETGLRWVTHRVQTNYQLAVPFTHVNEYQHTDGNYDNQYNHSLPSSMGNYPAQFILTRSTNAIVDEGEVMNLDLSIRQRTNLLSLPVFLRYAFGKSGREWGIRAGISTSRLLSVKAENGTELVSHHSAIHQRHTSIGNPSLDNLNRIVVDGGLGVDFRYRLTPHCSINLEYGLQRGLTPVYRDDTVKNYLMSSNLGLGLSLRL